MFKDYYELAKPGIIYGNAITVIGGFLLAARGRIDWLLLAATIVGISLVIGSACVFNNYVDEDIDTKMERTKDRALAAKRVPPFNAILFGILLGAIGFDLLLVEVNFVAAGVAALGFFFYVFIYTMWGKRSSPYGTLLGAISGATPPVVGYIAVAGRLDLPALILFFILAFWQMPHFYAIAIYRMKEYEAAGVPVLPAKAGIRTTKIDMLVYIILFAAAALALGAFGYANEIYSGLTTVLSFVWLWLSLTGFAAKDDNRWARRMFFYSLITLTVLFVSMSFAWS